MSLIYEFPEDWTLVASSDMSESYEVDEARIFQKADGSFVLATASGCSCWDGEWEAEDYARLEDIPAGVLNRDGFEFNPSLVGAQELVEQARKVTA